MFSTPKDATAHIHPAITSAINTFGFENTAKSLMAEAIAMFVAAHLYGQSEVQEEFDNQIHVLGKLSTKLSDINCDPDKSIDEKVNQVFEESVKLTDLRSDGLDLGEICKVRKANQISKTFEIIAEDSARALLSGRNPADLDADDLERLRDQVASELRKRLNDMGLSSEIDPPSDDDQSSWGNPMGDCL